MLRHPSLGKDDVEEDTERHLSIKEESLSNDSWEAAAVSTLAASRSSSAFVPYRVSPFYLYKLCHKFEKLLRYFVSEKFVARFSIRLVY